jgi:hypothetical protein
MKPGQHAQRYLTRRIKHEESSRTNNGEGNQD